MRVTTVRNVTLMAMMASPFLPTKKPHGLNRPWGVAGCLAVIKAAAIHRKSRRVLFHFQKSKKPAPKGNGLIYHLTPAFSTFV